MSKLRTPKTKSCILKVMANLPHNGMTTDQVIDAVICQHLTEITSELQELARIGMAELVRGESRKHAAPASQQLEFFLYEYAVPRAFSIRMAEHGKNIWKRTDDITVDEGRKILKDHAPKRRQPTQYNELARMINDAEALGAKGDDKLVDVLVEHQAAVA